MASSSGESREACVFWLMVHSCSCSAPLLIRCFLAPLLKYLCTICLPSSVQVCQLLFYFCCFIVHFLSSAHHCCFCIVRINASRILFFFFFDLPGDLLSWMTTLVRWYVAPVVCARQFQVFLGVYLGLHCCRVFALALEWTLWKNGIICASLCFYEDDRIAQFLRHTPC